MNIRVYVYHPDSITLRKVKFDGHQSVYLFCGGILNGRKYCKCTHLHKTKRKHIVYDTIDPVFVKWQF